MKKSFLTFGTAILFAIGSATFTGCGSGGERQENGEHHEHAEGEDHEHHDAEHAHYICPMNCEEGKTYEEPGKCPECEMDLVEAEG